MTQPLHTLSACEAAERLAQRSLRAEDLVRACLEHIDAPEPEVHASAPVNFRQRAEFRVWHEGETRQRCSLR